MLKPRSHLNGASTLVLSWSSAPMMDSRILSLSSRPVWGELKRASFSAHAVKARS